MKRGRKRSRLVGAGVAGMTYTYRFFAGPASQAEGEHALDMCSNAFSGGFRGSLSKKPILVRPTPDPQVDRQGQPSSRRPTTTPRTMRRIAPCIVGLTLAVNLGRGHAATCLKLVRIGGLHGRLPRP